MTRSPTQNGNVFFLILLGIAMFAGLSYAVMQGSRTGGASLSQDQARLAAQEIVSFGNNLAQAVQSLRLRGCTEGQLSNFQSPYYAGSGNTNAAAPSDKRCDLFDANGASLQPLELPSTWKNASIPAVNLAGYFNVDNTITGVGSAAAEYVFVIRNINLSICQQINLVSGITSAVEAPPVSGVRDVFGFNGTFGSSPYVVNQTKVNGKSSFCVNDTGDPSYKYVRVLLAR